MHNDRSRRPRHFPEPHELVSDDRIAPPDRRRTGPFAQTGPRPTRRLPSERDHLLSDAGFALLLEPGPDLTLEQTGQRYPHIVNRLALLWNDAQALDAYLLSLLLTDRNDRAGLAFEAVIELTNVRTLRVGRLRYARTSR